MTVHAAKTPQRVRRYRALWPAFYGVLYGNVWYLGFWAILIFVYSAIGLGIWLWGGSIDISLWETSTNSTKGTMTAVGIMLTPVFLPVMIANGVTRRSFVLASMAASGAMFTVASALVAAGYAVERPIYAANGIPETLQNTHLWSDTSQLHLIFAEAWLLQAAYLASGFLIGLCFYRFGPLLGILLIIPSAIAAATAELLLAGVTWFGEALRLDLPEGMPVWLLFTLSLAVTSATVWIARMVAVGTPLRPRKA